MEISSLQTFQYVKINAKYLKDSTYSCTINSQKILILISQGCYIKAMALFLVNGQLKEIYKLNEHKQDVSYLQFFPNLNEFVSVDLDCQIKIWNFDEKKQWNVLQTLEGHKSPISSVVLSKKENKIISGSRDQTIRCWERQKDTWTCDQIIQLEDQVLDLSLNDSEDKMITLLLNYQTLIFEKNQKWQVIQKMQNGFVTMLGFFTDDQFLQISFEDSKLEIYKYQNIKKECLLQKKINLRITFYYGLLFVQQLVKEKQILITNQGEFIYFFHINEKSELELNQIIEENWHVLSKGITDDGQFFLCNNYLKKRLTLWMLKS